jgi:cytochrome c
MRPAGDERFGNRPGRRFSRPDPREPAGRALSSQAPGVMKGVIEGHDVHFAIRRTLALLAVALLAAVALGPSTALALEPGDAKRGEDIYGRCMACHSLDYNRTGPRHCGVIGRKAGSLFDFDYSDAMKKSGLVWTPETLDKFLKKPTGFVPGTIMTYDGVPDDQERADVIAYLVMTNKSKELCP